jgi:hypothetical protein
MELPKYNRWETLMTTSYRACAAIDPVSSSVMAAVQHYNQTVTVSLTARVKVYFSIFTSLLKDEALRSRQ